MRLIIDPGVTPLNIAERNRGVRRCRTIDTPGRQLARESAECPWRQLGKFAGATGDMNAIGEADLSSGTVFRYSGKSASPQRMLSEVFKKVRGQRVLCVLVACCLTSGTPLGAAVEGNRAMYVGGTVASLHEKQQGTLDTSGTAEFVFTWDKGRWSVRFTKNAYTIDPVSGALTAIAGSP